MASLRITLVALVFLGIAMSETLATDHVVGDEKGWTVGVDYQAWANSKKFGPGDRLIFKYPPEAHNVVIIHNEDNFRTCTAPSEAVTYDTGNDTVYLKSDGTFYAICNVGNHCEDGQKVTVTVTHFD